MQNTFIIVASADLSNLISSSYLSFESFAES